MFQFLLNIRDCLLWFLGMIGGELERFLNGDVVFSGFIPYVIFFGPLVIGFFVGLFKRLKNI